MTTALSSRWALASCAGSRPCSDCLFCSPLQQVPPRRAPGRQMRRIDLINVWVSNPCPPRDQCGTGAQRGTLSHVSRHRGGPRAVEPGADDPGLRSLQDKPFRLPCLASRASENPSVAVGTREPRSTQSAVPGTRTRQEPPRRAVPASRRLQGWYLSCRRTDDHRQRASLKVHATLTARSRSTSQVRGRFDRVVARRDVWERPHDGTDTVRGAL